MFNITFQPLSFGNFYLKLCNFLNLYQIWLNIQKLNMKLMIMISYNLLMKHQGENHMQLVLKDMAH